MVLKKCFWKLKKILREKKEYFRTVLEIKSVFKVFNKYKKIKCEGWGLNHGNSLFWRD